MYFNQKIEPLAKPSKQRSFMENIKFFTHYGNEIVETLIDAEKRQIKIRERSDQLEMRPMLINLLSAFAKHQNYSTNTLHLGKLKIPSSGSTFNLFLVLGVHILDVYMDNYILSDFDEHQKLIGLVCLLLAAKSEDIDESVPSIKDLLRIVDMSSDLEIDLRFSEGLDPKEVSTAYKNFAKMYSKLEFLIFECLEFNTIRPTVVSFVNIYQNLVVTNSDVDDVKCNSQGETEDRKTLGDMRVLANQYLKHFLSIVIEDVDFFNSVPSLLAAAIIGVTRKLLQIQKYWNEQLEELTRYQIEEIRPMMLKLIEKRISSTYDNFDSDNENVKDSGYISPSSDTASDTDDELHLTVNKKRKLSFAGITYEDI